MSPSPEEVRRELDRILASRSFASSARLSRFLKFVVERSLAGDGERLKEYVLGVEVFDRGAEYDPRIDSIVRVEAGRVRTKLDEYYGGDGVADAILIRVQKGSYAPLFERRADARPSNGSDAALVAAGGATPVNGTGAAPPLDVALPAAGRVSRRRGAALLAIAALLAAGVTAWRRGSNTVPSRTAIAVLPFAPYSSDAAEQALAERLTERVTAELVRRGGLAVIASTSARSAAAAGGSSSDVSRRLDAEFLLEARTLRENGRLRVEPRLVSGSRNEKLWVDTLDGADGELDDLARRIAAGAGAAVESELERRAAPPP